MGGGYLGSQARSELRQCGPPLHTAGNIAPDVACKSLWDRALLMRDAEVATELPRIFLPQSGQHPLPEYLLDLRLLPEYTLAKSGQDAERLLPASDAAGL
mmetsp:Transcript_124555/g.240321  ORF Transcript_124555/g.240321 Transcript_124555/m.240321 type:complete len:100 (-) Transcript_124555:156-455(-)